MSSQREYDIDANDEDNEICAEDLKKYFFVIAAVALLILIGTFWYTDYYTKGVGGAPGMTGTVGTGAAQPMQPGVARAIPLAVNAFPPQSAMRGFMPIARRVGGGGFAAVARNARNSVVNVTATTGRGAVAQDPAQGASVKDKVRFANPFSGRTYDNVGSGVIVRNDGYILTNYHIVRGSGSVAVVVFNDQGSERYRANVVKLDEVLDLALLKIEPRTPLTPAMLGDSERVQVAAEVIAIGSPFGLDQTVSRGIVSAKRKSLMIEGVTHGDLIQTDAAINQGNSGGPLFALDGTVIGINTAIYTPTGAFAGIGFAIPSNQARTFVSEEINRIPGNAGPATARPVARAVPNEAQAGPPIAAGAAAPHSDGREAQDCGTCHQMTGATGRAVAMQTAPAAAPGPAIAVGTRSPHNDGRETMNCASCHQMIGRPGSQAVAFQRYQFAEPPTTLAMAVAMPMMGRDVAAPGGATAGNMGGFVAMGAGLLPIDGTLSTRLNHPVGKGVFVAQVVPGSPTANGGLRSGDVILKIDGRRVENPAQLTSILTTMANGDTARLGIMRNGQRTNLEIAVSALPVVAPLNTAPRITAQPMATQQAAVPMAQAAPAPARVPGEFNWRGMEIETFSAVVPVDAPDGPTLKGADVGELVPGSAAAKVGVQVNDVIVEINGMPTSNAARFNRAMKRADSQGESLLRMMRKGREFYVVLP